MSMSSLEKSPAARQPSSEPKADSQKSAALETEMKSSKSAASIPAVDMFAAKLNAADNKTPSPRTTSSATASPHYSSSSTMNNDSKSKTVDGGAGMERSGLGPGKHLQILPRLVAYDVGIQMFRYRWRSEIGWFQIQRRTAKRFSMGLAGHESWIGTSLQ